MLLRRSLFHGRRPSPPLRSHLTWLVLGSALPFILLLAGTFVANDYAARERASSQVLDIARGTALAVEGELRTMIISLEALALSPSLAAGDLDEFRRQADELAKKSFPGASIALVDLDGRQLFNTFAPPGSPLPRRPNLEALDQVKATLQPAISDIFLATLQQVYIAPVDVPVLGPDGKLRAILSLAPPLQTFAEIVRRQHLPANWVVSVLDRKAVVVARSIDPERYIGRPAMEAFHRLLQQQPEGSADVVSLDGATLLASWSRPGPSGWAVSVGIPRIEYSARERDTLVVALALSALAVIGAVALSRIVARRIAQPVQALIKLAEQAAAADDDATTDVASLGLREADTVAAALITSIQERKAARRQMHEMEAQSRVELERQVRERTEELHAAQAQLLQSQRMEAVGQLTAGVAHDFNNLLQVQVAGLHLLLREVRGQERPTRYAEMALASSDKAAKLTYSLMSFSRQQVLHPEPVDVGSLFERLQVLLSRTLDPRIELQIDVGAGTEAVLADPAQLEAALLNLCLNARDAMNGRLGKLLIQARNDEIVAMDSPKGLEAAPCVRLAVEDEGAGIDAAILARVCEPFFTTKEIGKGSGLGLSMVQGFVRQSGGELRIQSRLGVGTRVEISLPRTATAPRQVPAAAPSAGAVHSLRRVLVVDDDSDVRALVGEFLESADFAVTQVASGEEALGLIRSNADFDVLISDYAMPGMTGGELVAEALKLRPNLPAMLITGFAEALGTAPKGVVVLRKPFRFEEIVARVTELTQAD